MKAISNYLQERSSLFCKLPFPKESNIIVSVKKISYLLIKKKHYIVFSWNATSPIHQIKWIVRVFAWSSPKPLIKVDISIIEWEIRNEIAILDGCFTWGWSLRHCLRSSIKRLREMPELILIQLTKEKKKKKGKKLSSSIRKKTQVTLLKPIVCTIYKKKE